MDREGRITKRTREIPQCRKDFSLNEAISFINEVMGVFQSLEDLSDLRSLYETGKQLHEVYKNYPLNQADLAQHLITCDYPAFVSKMLHNLNNKGVLKHDSYFPPFYLYKTIYRFSESLLDFANALVAAGLPKILKNNIGYKSYITNLEKRNVNFLVKVSILTIYNIVRIPSNMHHFTKGSVRHDLLYLAEKEDEFLRCACSVCLAHIVTESEVGLISNPTFGGGIDLAHNIHRYFISARSAIDRRHHGFQATALLCALSVCSVHDPWKASFLTLQKGSSNGTVAEQSTSIVSLLKDLIEIALMEAPSTVALREAEEAARTLWNLTFCDQTQSSHTNLVTAFNTLSVWITRTLAKPAAQMQLKKEMLRTLEAIQWRLIRPMSTGGRLSFSDCGTIVFSFAPANRNTVLRVAERLRDTGLSLSYLLFAKEALDLTDATVVGMSMAAINTATHSQWLDSIEQAPVLVACFSDDYRLSPGCRMEAEYFLSTSSVSFPKAIIPIVVQPDFTTTGWLTRLNISKPAIDFSKEGESHTQYDTLITQLKELMDKAKKRTEPSVNVKTESRKYHSLNGKQHMVLAGETGIARMSSMDESHNQIPSKCRCMASGMMCMGNVYEHKSSTFISHGGQPVATQAWRHVIRPEVRSWSTNQVATWLNSRGLGHIQRQIAVGLDGVLLSQLAAMRLTSLEYFMLSLHEDLKLGLTDRLRFVEALDELAPRSNCSDGDNGSSADR